MLKVAVSSIKPNQSSTIDKISVLEMPHLLCIKSWVRYIYFKTWIWLDFCVNFFPCILLIIGGYFYKYKECNLIKIRSLACFPLLIFHGVGDLRKLHSSDHMYHPMKMGSAVQAYESVTKLLCLLRPIHDWGKKGYNRIFHIII